MTRRKRRLRLMEHYKRDGHIRQGEVELEVPLVVRLLSDEMRSLLAERIGEDIRNNRLKRQCLPIDQLPDLKTPSSGENT